MTQNAGANQVPANAFTATAMPYNIVSGLLSFGSAINVVANSDGSGASGALAAGAYGASGSVDNSSNGYLGLTLYLRLDLSAVNVSPGQAFAVWLQNSVDTTNWPDNGFGLLVKRWFAPAKAVLKDVISI